MIEWVDGTEVQGLRSKKISVSGPKFENKPSSGTKSALKRFRGVLFQSQIYISLKFEHIFKI